MGNKSVRIRTTVGGNDKYLKMKLEQDVNMIEILSLQISQKDIYASFNSDFGVLIGRVTANGGIGIPNAKLSIFIPVTDEDKNISDIFSIYPYTNPRDKNADGVRYNLLPRVGINNPFLITGAYAPSVPIGTFPTKEEITINPPYKEVYEKYYKFTTVTNQSGDYMIYGVPVGVQTVHMSVDITDIGQYSMTPATMVSQLGYSPQLFENNKIKFTTDLDNVPSVDLQDISVDVRPFWGDTDNFEIGITRQDFKIKATLVTSVTVFGAGFTDDFDACWGMDQFFANRDDSRSAMSNNRSLQAAGASINQAVKYNTGLASRRNGLFSIEVYTLNTKITNNEIVHVSNTSNDLNPNIDLGIYSAPNADTKSDFTALVKGTYGEILEDGMFILTLPCNRNRKIVNEFGDLIQTTDDDPNGIFTEFYGSFIINYAPELTQFQISENRDRGLRDRGDRGRLKIPQFAESNFTANQMNTFSSERGGNIGGRDANQRKAYNEDWRKQFYKFSGGSLYTVSKFNGVMFESGGNAYNQIAEDIWRNAGNLADVVTTHDVTGVTVNGNIIYPATDASMGFAYNATTDYNKIGTGGNELLHNRPVFGAEWLNFCLYFPQVWNYTNGGVDTSQLFTSDYGAFTDMTIRNTYRVLGFRTDTSYFLRSDMHKSTFVKVPVVDIINIVQQAPDKKGFTSIDTEFISPNNLQGKYPNKNTTQYFYRGLKAADIIEFLLRNGVVNA